MIKENTWAYATLKRVLSENEKVGAEVSENIIMIVPAHAYATSKRIIIVRDFFHIHKSIKIIRYEDIAETRVERGIIFAKLHFGLISEPTFIEQNLKWLELLNYKETLEFVQYVNNIHSGMLQMQGKSS